jgi:hypothetical protein
MDLLDLDNNNQRNNQLLGVGLVVLAFFVGVVVLALDDSLSIL